jgi:hypothetical protein
MQGLGLANPTNADPKSVQTFESLSPNSYSLSGNQAPQFMQGEQVPGPVSAVGGIPPAEQLGQLGVGNDPSITPARALELQQKFELDPITLKPYGASPNPNNATVPTTPGASSAATPAQAPSQAAAAPAQAPSTTPSGNFYLGANEGLNPAGARVSAPGDSSIINRAADFYKTPSFDNFGKIFSDPNATTMMGKYGPGAAAVLGATALAGGFKSEPAKTNPAFNPQYTGLKYIEDNPTLFSGSLRAGQFSSNPPTFVPTRMSQLGIPMPQVNSPMLPTYSPGSLTNMAGGVPQPYNRPYAQGGDVNHFPRKVGQIDGPGTGTSDSIPAMLSDGEFVFTAKAVRNAGDGSRRKGAAKMYKLMKSLENGPLGSK